MMLQSGGSDYPNFWCGLDFEEQEESEDLSISLDAFYEILNENSDQSLRFNDRISASSADDLVDKISFQDPLNAIAQNLEEAFHPQDVLQQSRDAFPSDTGLPRSSPSSLSDHLEVSYSLKQTGLEFSHEYPGNFDGFGALYSASLLDSGKMDTSLQQIDSKFPVMNGPSLTSDWLSLSTLEPGSCFLDPARDSVEALLSKGTDDQYLHNESSNSNIPPNLKEEEVSPFPDHMEMVDLTLSDSEFGEEFGQTEARSSLLKEEKESAIDINLASVFPISDQNKKRTGFVDFSHLQIIKNSGLSFGIDNGIEVKSEPQKGTLDISQVKGTLDISQVNADFVDTAIFSQATPYAELSVWPDASTFSHMDRDSDMCILEDTSDHRYPYLPVPPMKSLNTSQFPKFSAPFTRVGIEKPRVKDETLTYRAALQDLSQARSEASPPDGVLSVPLLRHQRIALSWMVKKETTSVHCSGGILADDQGLGKTVSTIALILAEKSPSSKVSPEAMEHVKTEALNLDEDEDGVSGPIEMKQAGNSVNHMLDKSVLKSENTITTAKGRPAAGTLVVCPTSVMRQWAEELQNKVAEKAKLKVLVYHGSSRTKDPLELARYDVVVTTYSIVSMEVPKQPLVDQDDDEKKKPEGHVLPADSSSSRKRKHPPNSNKKKMKDRKGKDGSLLESGARPLARVGWFRVVLDEAQTIKNHRTQVARACWGLRAKRRWCLSGTPIQNAIDDLYSYFRFLRYDPYAGYMSFCSMIKVPINRSPTKGYKKLQAVLKTIMLRRTKGTLIDGEPIIKLPPKSVSLKKVEFSSEERAFYSQLEAESRAQFQEYADAGTVKNNYVNILLMLLRLRQACDHPLLVKRSKSNTEWCSSQEIAKKLPREKQIALLNCLEACMAICSICNDPPEDAVVTMCGHVFCNQCICEHLTGDDNQCPAVRCKVQLNAASIFSKLRLRSSLSDEPEHVYSDNSGSGLAGTPDMCSESLSSDSSKIKAALEILKSLSKPRQPLLNTNSEKCCGEVDDGCLDLHDKRDWNMEKSSNVPVLDAPEKAIVFSQWTSMLDLLEVPLKSSSIQYRRLDGTMSVIARDKAVKDFNTLPEVTVMIMSLKAASLGLNMVAACHVLLLDLWWNPTTEDQAIDRAHRIGQTRPVTVSRLTVKDTVEDRILALQEKKREMVASAFGEDEKGRRQTRLTVEDLKYLFMA